MPNFITANHLVSSIKDTTAEIQEEIALVNDVLENYKEEVSKDLTTTKNRISELHEKINQQKTRLDAVDVHLSLIEEHIEKQNILYLALLGVWVISTVLLLVF